MQYRIELQAAVQPTYLVAFTSMPARGIFLQYTFLIWPLNLPWNTAKVMLLQSNY